MTPDHSGPDTSASDGGPQPPLPSLALIARIAVRLAEPLDLGVTALGHQRIVGITGGEFAGPGRSGEGLSGVVLPGGSDWQTICADGRTVVDTRYTLRAHDGALIAIATQGVRHGPPAVLAALAAGRPVDPSDYYFRISARFSTGAAAYDWLTSCVVVGAAVRNRDSVVYDAYRVT